MLVDEVPARLARFHGEREFKGADLVRRGPVVSVAAMGNTAEQLDFHTSSLPNYQTPSGLLLHPRLVVRGGEAFHADAILTA